MGAPTKPDDTKALQAVAEYFAALEAIDDPMERYDEATAAMERWRDVPEQLGAVREGAVLDMAESGEMSLAEIGRHAGFTRGRAQALVARARARRQKRT